MIKRKLLVLLLLHSLVPLAGCPPESAQVPELALQGMTLAGTVVPDHGPERGSTRIRVAGQQIHALARLQVGGQQAGNVQVGPSGTWIEGLTPPGEGSADVVVLAPGGQKELLAAAFRYDPGPLVEALEPDRGPQRGGTRVTVRGRSFAEGVRVTLGASKAGEVQWIDAGTLTFVTPPGQGLADLRVVNPDGQVFLRADAFSYLPPPRVISLAPASGAEGGGTPVVVTGTGFQEGMTATLGGRAVAEPQVEPPSSFAFVSPPGQGEVELRVLNPDGQEYVLEKAFSYLPLPVVTALVPDHGPESGGITVEVRGTGFSAGITRIYIGSNLLRNARFDAGQGTITGQVPAGNGVVPVHAANLEVNGPALEQGFTYDPPPQPSAVQPSSGPASGGTRITVLGSGFQQGARVLVGGLESAEVQVLDGTTLHALVPAGEPGLADVTVVNPDGQRGRLPAAFSRVPAPVLLDVSPGRGCVLGGARVTLSGRHFQDQAEVRFGAAAAEVLERAGDRELQVVAPPGEGTVDVAVVNPDGQQDVLAGGFTYTATPQPTRVIPAHGPLAGGGEVLLEGSCFPAEAQVSFAGEPAEVTGRPSAEQLVVRVPPAAAEATVEVAVAPPGGELGLLELGYTYHDAVFEEEVPSRRSGALCGLAEDLDGDGAQDLLLAGDSAWIWRGGGQGLELSPTVAFSTGAGKTVLDVASVPLGLPAGPALVLAVEDLADEQGGGLALLSPVAARSWEALAAPRFLSHELVFSIGVGDLTGDGLPDLVAGEAGGNELFVQQAGRRFQPMEEWIGRQGSGVTLAVLIGNFTGDGSADLFLAVRGGDGNRLLEGTGGGGFIDRSNRLPLSETATLDALAMDIDGDGDLDLLLAEEQGRDRLWRNEVDEGGAQGFRDRTDELFPGVAEMTVSLFAADLDGDRRLDLLATQGPGAQRGHRIYRNAGGGRLEEVSAAWLPRGMRAPAMLGLVVAGPAGVPDLILTSVDAMLWLRDRIGE